MNFKNVKLWILLLVLQTSLTFDRGHSAEGFNIQDNQIKTCIESFNKSSESYCSNPNINSLASVIGDLNAVMALNVNISKESSSARMAILLSIVKLSNKILVDLNPKFNPDDVPEINVEVPTNQSGVSIAGVAPTDVKDEVARKKYEEMIQKNNEKAVAYDYQNEIYKAKVILNRSIVAFLKVNFSEKLKNQDEVVDLYLNLLCNMSTQEIALKSLR